MPPGPTYNLFCVASSVYNILSHAAHIRAAQLARAGQVVGGAELLPRKRKRHESSPYDSRSVIDAVEKSSDIRPEGFVPSEAPVREVLRSREYVPPVGHAADVIATQVRLNGDIMSLTV